MTIYNKRMYRLDGIDFEITPSHTFSLKNGESMSFLEYYKKQYNSKLRETKQPLVFHYNKKRRS